MVGAPQQHGYAPDAESCDPFDIHLEFSWTGTASERWFSVVQGAILRVLDPLMGRALYIKEHVLPRAMELADKRDGGAPVDAALDAEMCVPSAS
jgi:hypothetical protein